MPANTTQNETEETSRVTCDNCGCATEYRSLVHLSRAYPTDLRGAHWCDTCLSDEAYSCSDCGRYFNYELDYTNADDNAVCDRCSGNYFTCDNCEGRYSVDDNYAGDGLCTSCHSSSSPIADYSVDPPRQFYGKGPHYYGVELEVEAVSKVNEHAEETRDLLGDFVICKHDGSLDCGFEIVTSPASLNEQRTRWGKFFDGLTSGKVSGLRSFKTDTCGLHVHCSRAPLTDLTVAKIVCFTNANHNRRFMSCIAGRQSSNWARMVAKKKLSDGVKMNPNRYEAVNLQNNATIEFRIFKGTLKRESFFKAIEFCDALIAFETPASRSLRDSLSRVKFIEFVRLQKARWPHLAAFIDARWFGLITKETLTYKFKPIDANQEENAQNEEQ